MPEPILNSLLIVIFVVVLTAGYAGLSAAPWVPTRKGERASLVAKLKLKDGQTVYDLGSGDGSLLFALIERFPNCRLIGLEISLLPFLISLIRRLTGWSRYKNVRLLFRDFYRTDLSKADLVFAYLMPGCYTRISEKFSKELKNDCIVVIEAWPIPGIEVKDKIVGDRQLPLYVYEGRQFRTGK
ncbi:hypothetical protein A2480_02820 [Candidatus Uhrbacteria bacterium RIFOXYC2_FULL_47_19]|uniref:Methyltransferase domain-containing protein n=1 Tax=Candidatus Uhrbacteria bacterium RIFOXYC2_FULL_47_19 TaxID=1802424 RepID=A0A1F7WE27_9BACT|nr:MAG: hypothetical protein A2480_02820 [Candidatus Uhrbacteria bacterium RIFOXYC2_FULL_47_19]HCC22264.1 hypothetical protein [Candidatus Uhrbacteria bacterium]